MQEINAWLQSSQSFDDGVQLYGTYGKSKFLKDLFASGPTPYNKEKLEAELIAIAPTPPATVEVKAESEKPKAEKVKEPAENQIDKSELENQKTILELKTEQSLKYRQLERHMSILDLESDKKILHFTSKQILLLHGQITDIWRKLDYFDEHGHFPFQKVKSAPTTDKYQLLHASISKAKARINSGACRNIVQTQKLIAQKEAELLTIRNPNK